MSVKNKYSRTPPLRQPPKIKQKNPKNKTEVVVEERQSLAWGLSTKYEGKGFRKTGLKGGMVWRPR